MSSDEDYELEPETVYLLSVFRKAGDAHQRGLEWEHLAEHGADVVGQMDEVKKGAVVIDLLTLFCEFEHQVLAERAAALLKEVE